MANRFTRDSSAELWTHLEALSREGVRWFATTAARDAEFTAPVAGMSCYVGSAVAMVEYVHDGTTWLAAMEYGSDPTKGRYVRFASGLQICWLQTARTDVAINSAYGPLFLGAYTWTYAKAFASVPAVTCSQFQSGTAGGWGTVNGAPNNTNVILRGIDAFSAPAGPSVLISATAIGVWR